MRKLFVISTVGLFIVSAAAQPNTIALPATIKVTEISLQITGGNEYRDSKGIIEVSLDRINDSVAGLQVLKMSDFATTNNNGAYPSPQENQPTVPATRFDELVALLGKLDLSAINKSNDFNMQDGKAYVLVFGNSEYTLHAGTNNVSASAREKYLSDFWAVVQKMLSLATEKK